MSLTSLSYFYENQPYLSMGLNNSNYITKMYYNSILYDSQLFLEYNSIFFCVFINLFRYQINKIR